MPKRRPRRYKMQKPDRIRLSRQLDDHLSRRQIQLEQEETLVQEEKTKSSARIAGWSYPVRAASFFLVLLIWGVAVFLAPHPTHSEIEKRDLAKFPKWTVKSFFSGEYFDGINLWFSDTFPGREGWISLNSHATDLYRIGEVEFHGHMEPGDDIPDVPARPTQDASTTAAPTKPTVLSTTSTEKPTETAAPTSTAPASKTTRATNDRDYWHDEKDAPAVTLGGVLVRGDSAFEYYNFSKSTADEYVRVVNKAASQLKGKAKVYDIVVPTSIGVMLPASVRDSLNSSDQKKAIDYLYGSMSADVVTVPIMDVLREHCNEYLYFHSDHHWTARGAYYAYAAFAQKAGFAPHALGEYTESVFEGFRGSFFADTQNSKLQVDTVIAYNPIGGGSLYFIDGQGERLDWHIITDVSEWAASSKYNTFIGGDNPYTEITSDSVHDGSSVVVIKESFGNAMVPFLTDHFEKVYVLDYRYYDEKTLSGFVADKGVKSVVFVNNMSATRNAGLVANMERLVG